MSRIQEWRQVNDPWTIEPQPDRVLESALVARAILFCVWWMLVGATLALAIQRWCGC